MIYPIPDKYKPKNEWYMENSWGDPNQEEKCLIDEFFKRNPDAKVAMISCQCKKCSITCL